MNEYGPLASIVSLSLAIVATGTSISLAWRGKHKWAPVQEQLGGGAEKISVLVAAVVVVVLFVTYSAGARTGELTAVVLVGAVCTLLLFAAYQYLFGRFTYRVNRGKKSETRIIGGSTLTSQAESAMKERNIADAEDLLPGFANSPLQVWTRASIERNKTVLSVGYALLILLGTVCLGSAAVRLFVTVSS